MTENCPHLRAPTAEALKALRNPPSWSCRVCASTDGVWCCLGCGHVGCGRRAHLPALGGGHSRHHYQTSLHGAIGWDAPTSPPPSDISPTTNDSSERSDRESEGEIGDDEGGGDDGEGKGSGGVGNAPTPATVTGHEVCLDVVSKAVHCYACDDYVLSDASWLSELRKEIAEIEVREPPASDENGGDGIGAEDADSDAAQLSPPSGEGESVKTEGDQLKVTPGCTGLRNLGNTCYMNSVLQALSHCSGFRSFFHEYLRASAPINLGLSSSLPGAPPRVKLKRDSTQRFRLDLQKSDVWKDRLGLCEATHALLRVLWSGRWDAIAPRSYVHAVWEHCGGLFAPRRQQDAGEFLSFVLGRLDDELRPPGRPLYEPSAVLYDLFGVDQRQTVKCDGCGTETTLVEPLLGLMLSLPDEDDAGAGGKGSENAKSHKNEFEDKASKDATSNSTDERKVDDAIPLQSCLNTLLSNERLDGTNQFRCDTCKAKRDATKTVSLSCRPQALLLSFRRTRWSLKKGLHKDKRRVEFPMELDASDLLQPHKKGGKGDRAKVKEKVEGSGLDGMDVPCLGGSGNDAVRLPSMNEVGLICCGGSEDSDPEKDERKWELVSSPPDEQMSEYVLVDEDDDDSCHYRLSAVVVHSGSSPMCGHYVAWCYVPEVGTDSSKSDCGDKGQWHLFNDATVSKAKEDDVLKTEAFILLYERQRKRTVDANSIDRAVVEEAMDVSNQ